MSQDLTNLLSVGNGIFTPSIKPPSANQLSRLSGITKKLTVYTWPSNQNYSANDKLIVLAFLSPFIRSKSESISQWSTWMFSYIFLCFDSLPDMLLQRNSSEYDIKTLPKSLIVSILKINDIIVNEDVSEDLSLDRYCTAVSELSFPLDFPDIEKSIEIFPENLAASRIIPSIYGFCSLLIFLCGKQINEKNLSTITEARPQNLIDTYSIHEQSVYILKSPNVHSLLSAQMCNKSWNYHYPMRKLIISEVSRFSAGETLPCRVVYTVSKLLEYVGMQQAFYIHKFLLANPQCKDYVCLKSALAAYTSSLTQLRQEEPHIIPYFKVIHADMTKIFHRNSILPLAAVAINYELRNNRSISNYNLGPGMTAAMDMFYQEAKSRGDMNLCEGFEQSEEEKL